MWIMTQRKLKIVEVKCVYTKETISILGEDKYNYDIELAKYKTPEEAKLVLRLIVNHLDAGKTFFEMPTVEELKEFLA